MSQHDAPGVIMEEPTPSGAKPAPKSRAVWIAVAVIVVIIVVVLAAVLGGLFNPAPTKPALRIGTLLSITGALSQYGPGDTQGAYLAVTQITAAGGVLGQPIQLFTEDDQTDQTAAAAATTKLITQNHVNAIVGAQFSGGTIASIGIAKAAGVPMVSPSATSPALSNLTLTGGYFFRTAPSDALQGVVAANYLFTNLSYRYVNLVGRDDSHGRGLDSQTFMDQLHSSQVNIDVTKIKGTSPVSPFGAVHDVFVAQYKAATTTTSTPVLYTDYTYDAVYLIALAAQKAGSVDGTAIKANLPVIAKGSGTVITPGNWTRALSSLAAGGSVNWEGAAGSEDFDANGDVRGPYEVWGVNSTFQIVRLAFIPESSIQTAPPLLPSSHVVTASSSGFVEKVQTAVVTRRF